MKNIITKIDRKIAILSFILAFMLTSFFAGFILCSTGDPNGCGIGDRLFIGIIFLLLGFITGGNIPVDESGSSGHYNLWPYIIPIFILLYFTIYNHKRKKRNS